jgi:hypothetical protein
MNMRGLSCFWKRIWDGWQALDEGFHYREGDYLAERIARLEKDVEAIKAALPSTSSTDPARKRG